MFGQIRLVSSALVLSAFAAVFCVGCGDNSTGGGDEEGGEGYVITFDAVGGDADTTSRVTGKGGRLASLPDAPHKNNYEFEGWFTDSAGGSVVTKNTVFKSDGTVYAHWRWPETFVDVRDGHEYKQVKIGDQVWMAENLNYHEDNMGSDLRDVCYNKEEDSCARYGRLYDWSEAMDLDYSYDGSLWGGNAEVNHQGVCPAGWHLPSKNDWVTLIDYVGGSDVAGTKLKSPLYWDGYAGVPAGEDEFGFSALPGGFRFVAGGMEFKLIDQEGLWWSATESDGGGPYVMELRYDREAGVVTGSSPYGAKAYELSVRCVKNY